MLAEIRVLIRDFLRQITSILNDLLHLKKHKKIDIMEIVSLKLYNNMFNVTLTNDDMIPLTMLFGYFHLKEKLLL